MRNFDLWRKHKILSSLSLAAIFLLFFTNNMSAADIGKSKSDPSVEMQGITVRGVVKDAATNEAMPGVNIKVNGTTLGTITDVEGKYSFAAVDRNATLVFTFIGYVTQQIPLNGRTTLDVAMPSEILGLNEVVVVEIGRAHV
jgi:hypothetical protein